MRVFFIISILCLFSCSSPQKDKIVVPKLHASFYDDAFSSIEEELEEDPNNQRLVNQKIFYCEQLGWPVSCISALESSRKTAGMTNQLIKQYITYYIEHDQHELLLDIIDKWVEEYDLKEEFNLLYIESLIRSDKRKEAFLDLRQYLIDNNEKEDRLFAGEQYLILGDSGLAVYNLGKISENYPHHPLIQTYGNILIHMGHSARGLDIIETYADGHKDKLDVQMAYACLLEKEGENGRARKILKPFVNEEDTVSYLLADWFLKDLMWDSAGLVLTTLIEKDSSNRKPIWKAGRLYEERGWFSASMRYYEHLLELDEQDTLAAQRIDLIQRKIAYLQRLKFEESKIPTIELKPKKIKINE